MIDMSAICKHCGHIYGDHSYEANACPVKFGVLSGDPTDFSSDKRFEYDPYFKSEVWELEDSLEQHKRAVAIAVEKITQYEKRIRELELWQSEAVGTLKNENLYLFKGSLSEKEYQSNLDTIDRLIAEAQED